MKINNKHSTPAKNSRPWHRKSPIPNFKNSKAPKIISIDKSTTQNQEKISTKIPDAIFAKNSAQNNLLPSKNSAVISLSSDSDNSSCSDDDELDLAELHRQYFPPISSAKKRKNAPKNGNLQPTTSEKTTANDSTSTNSSTTTSEISGKEDSFNTRIIHVLHRKSQEELIQPMSPKKRKRSSKNAPSVFHMGPNGIEVPAQKTQKNAAKNREEKSSKKSPALTKFTCQICGLCSRYRASVARHLFGVHRMPFDLSEKYCVETPLEEGDVLRSKRFITPQVAVTASACTAACEKRKSQIKKLKTECELWKKKAKYYQKTLDDISEILRASNYGTEKK